MERRNIDVAIAGHIGFDIIPKFPPVNATALTDVLVPGKLVNMEEAVVSSGGPVSNTGIAMSKLGLKVEFMAKISDDMFGKAILTLLKQYIKKPDGMHIARNENTSYTIAISVPGIDRLFLHCPGTNDSFGYADVNFNIVKKAKLFHLGYPPLMKNLYANDGAELIKIFKKAKSAGATTSLDMSLPDPNSESGRVDWDKILRRVIPYVDILHPSIEEAMFMVNRQRYLQVKQESKGKDTVDFIKPEDFTKTSDILLGYGAKIITLKCGHNGFYVRTAGKNVLKDIGYAKPADMDKWCNRELWSAAFRVEKIASATGSGDSALAGFITAYLKNEPVEVCIRCSNATGAQNIQVFDAISGIKTWKETIKTALDPETKLETLEVSAPGWTFNSTWKMFQGPENKS